MLIRTMTVAMTAVLVSTLGSAPSQARPVWDTSPVKVIKHTKPTPKVIDMRAGEHKNFDRVVIDVKGKLPGYKVRYVRQLTYDGSGAPVDVHGRKFIQVTLTPAKAHNAKGEPVYMGPRIGHFEFDVLRDVAFTGDFEAVVSFGISLRRKEDFRVFTLDEPNRIVIDVHH
jgi:hypothetical protein